MGYIQVLNIFWLIVDVVALVLPLNVLSKRMEVTATPVTVKPVVPGETPAPLDDDLAARSSILAVQPNIRVRHTPFSWRLGPAYLLFFFILMQSIFSFATNALVLFHAVKVSPDEAFGASLTTASMVAAGCFALLLLFLVRGNLWAIAGALNGAAAIILAIDSQASANADTAGSLKFDGAIIAAGVLALLVLVLVLRFVNALRQPLAASLGFAYSLNTLVYGLSSVYHGVPWSVWLGVGLGVVDWLYEHLLFKRVWSFLRSACCMRGPLAGCALVVERHMMGEGEQ